MTIAIVTGGRNGRDFYYVHQHLQTLHTYHRFTLIKAGGAPGYDTLAVNVCKLLNIPYRIYPADWDRYPRTAGPIRNRQMIIQDEWPDMVIAFPGNRGTHNMINQARREHIRVVQIPEPTTPAIAWKPHATVF